MRCMNFDPQDHDITKKGAHRSAPFSFANLGSPIPPDVSACGLVRVRGERTRPGCQARRLGNAPEFGQLQPLVPPQVLHFMQVPLRTSV